MCGISLLFHKPGLNRNLFEDFVKCLRTINHRGPDDEGIILVNSGTNDFKIVQTSMTHSEVAGQVPVSDIKLGNYNLMLGHKRLSILDLSVMGHQPMQGKDGSWIIFNGEIYNYIEVRDELKNLGSVFNTETDTEVILEAYRVWGKNCLNKFNGMWSFCIWDAPQKKLFVSNDRFGVKPLYYREDKDSLLLISETKQLKSFRHFNLQLNSEKIKEFVDYGYADTDDKTLYNGVFRFQKSHFALIDLQTNPGSVLKQTQERYYTLKISRSEQSEKNAIENFRNILHDAVKIRMRCDVDFGFAISGGLDSSAILYAAKNLITKENLNNNLSGFGVVFPGNLDADESKFINIVSADVACNVYLTNPLNDFNINDFEKHVYHQDELVSGTSFLAQWCLYKKVKENGVKILFNGQGADEVFAGYHHHFYRYCRQLLVRGKLPEYFHLVNNYSEIKQISKKNIHRNILNEIKLSLKIKMGIEHFDNKLLKYWHEADKLDKLLIKDFDTYMLPTYLRVDDRNSMAFSVESRHPFMDYRLVEYGYSLPYRMIINNGWQKSIIRKSMYEMPDAIRYRADKKGFTTPQKSWLDRYRNVFTGYLQYNNKHLGTSQVSENPYRNYAVGAWLKTHIGE